MATSTAAHASTLARSTHSTSACSPAPCGPNRTVGMPASPSSAASVQKVAPPSGGAAPSPVVAACQRLGDGRLRRGFQRRAVEGQRHRSARKLGVGGVERVEDGVDFGADRGRCLAGQGAPLHLQRADAPGRWTARCRRRSARRGARRGPAADARGASCKARSSASSAPSTRPMWAMASMPSARRLPCAARPCVVIVAQAKPLCATPSCRSVGSVTMAAVHR